MCFRKKQLRVPEIGSGGGAERKGQISETELSQEEALQSAGQRVESRDGAGAGAVGPSHPGPGRSWPPDLVFLILHPPLRMCPIFQISNVTGENLDLLKMFLNLLSPRTSYREEEPAEFQIDDTYSVPVSGFWWTEQGRRLGGHFLQGVLG